MKGEGDEGSCELIMTGLEGRTVKVYCWPCELKESLLRVFSNRYRDKKSISEINSCIPGTKGCVHLLKQ